MTIVRTAGRRCLRPNKAATKLAIGVSTLWLRVRTDADFPKPIKIGPRTTVFFEDELDAYLERCMAKAKVAREGAYR